MENELKKLSQDDLYLLLKAPAIVSFMAAATEGKMDEKEKADAIELSHLRTYTSEEMLQPYYKEVEKNFKAELNELIRNYSLMDEEKKRELQDKMEKINAIINKLDPAFALSLKESLNTYAKHVANIHRTFLEYFVFPMNIPGVTD